MTKKEIFESALQTSAKLNNSSNPVTLLTNDERKTALRLIQLLDFVEEAKKEIAELEPAVFNLFEHYGVEFAKEGKSSYFALSFREHYERNYLVFRKGAEQATVDYAGYAKAMGETSETLKAKGFYTMRKGTSKIEKPNKSQLKKLMELFTD